MTAGLMPNPPKGIIQQAAGPLLDRCSFWGQPPLPNHTKPPSATTNQTRKASNGETRSPELTPVNVMNFQ